MSATPPWAVDTAAAEAAAVVEDFEVTDLLTRPGVLPGSNFLKSARGALHAGGWAKWRTPARLAALHYIARERAAVLAAPPPPLTDPPHLSSAKRWAVAARRVAKTTEGDVHHALLRDAAGNLYQFVTDEACLLLGPGQAVRATGDWMGDVKLVARDGNAIRTLSVPRYHGHLSWSITADDP